ncbi:MAG TPA: class I SAM-dependent methyltransferase [bacterium]|nr:class I SAM-dependent methyltransferase [bacterium]
MPVDEEKRSSAYLLSEIGGQEVERLRKQAAIWLSLELPDILKTLPQTGRFVDLGCGIGLLADAVAQERPDVQVFGFDADAIAVEQSLRRFGGRPGLVFDQRRLEQGPPPGFQAADVAVLRLVLMHLPDPKGALEAARAWLKPDGVLHVIETDDRFMSFEPLPAWLPGLLDLMQAIQKKRGGDRWLGAELAALLSSAGWNVVGQKQSALDPSATAAAVPKVFLPVAEFYLAEAERRAFIGPDRIEMLRQGLGQIREGLFVRATIPVFHAWARGISGVIA